MRGAAAKLRGGLLVGLIVGGLSALVAYERPGIIERGEFWTYDLRARGAAKAAEAAQDIVLIDVDEQDIRDVERNFDLSFPWPRVLYGYLAKHVAAGHPKAIVFDWFFQGRGSLGVADANEFAAAMAENGRSVIGVYVTDSARTPHAAAGRWGAPVKTFASRAEALPAAVKIMAFDRQAFVSAAGQLSLGGEASAADLKESWGKLAGTDELKDVFPAGDPPAAHQFTDAEMATELTDEGVVAGRSGLAIALPPELKLVNQQSIDAPLPVLALAAARLGNVVAKPEDDGVLRRHVPLSLHDGKLYPSLPLAAFMVAHPEVTPKLDGTTLVLGEHRMALDEDGRFAIRYHGGSNVYPHVSAYKVLQSFQQMQEGQTPVIPPETFKDKYVVVSATANALTDVRSSPVARVHIGAAINATALDNLEAGTVIERAPRGRDAVMSFVLALFVAVVMVVIWRGLRSTLWALVATTAVTVVVLGGYWLWADSRYAHGIWIAAAVPMGGAALSTFASLLVASALERNDKRFIETALGRYTSKALTRELMKHPEYLALGGAKREMSVYFSDIAGFTTISEKLSPEVLVTLLNEYLTVMTDIVDDNDGYVDKYIGDAVMAFWGGLVPDEQHAIKAVKAALVMRNECVLRSADWKKRYGVEVMARSGLNAGEGVVGNMGSHKKYNYTAMGDMVNIASRLEGANKPYGTLLMISETVYTKVKDVIDVRELDFMTVKGKELPITVYEVLEEKGMTDKLILDAVAVFHEGLALYRAQKFEEAKVAFRRAISIRPDDGPSHTYLTRCDHFLTEPPPADWDGVWHMKEK